MDILNTILRKLTGAAAPSAEAGQGGMMDVIVGLLNDPQTGGLQGLINAFRDKGMGDAVASWISTGKNLPISGEQLQSVLGSEQLQAIAQRLGVSSTEAADGLATALPEAIDKLTPTGELPQGSLLEQGLAMLTGMGKKT